MKGYMYDTILKHVCKRRLNYETLINCFKAGGNEIIGQLLNKAAKVPGAHNLDLV